MGDAQSSRVGVDPVRYHAIEDRPAGGDLITGQQTHYTRVPVVELDHKTAETEASAPITMFKKATTTTQHH